jgi:hypothetical protein
MRLRWLSLHVEVDYSSREDPLRVSPGAGCVVDDALHPELYSGRRALDALPNPKGESPVVGSEFDCP